MSMSDIFIFVSTIERVSQDVTHDVFIVIIITDDMFV